MLTAVVIVKALAAPGLLVSVTALLVRFAAQLTPSAAKLLASVTPLTLTAFSAS